jgi:hypothetical protein
MLKINFLKYKKYYFYIFLNKKYFKNFLLSSSQNGLNAVKDQIIILNSVGFQAKKKKTNKQRILPRKFVDIA